MAKKEFKPYAKVSDSEICIGTRCFEIKADDRGTHIKPNPEGDCPSEVIDAFKEVLSRGAAQGKPTYYEVSAEVEPKKKKTK